MRVGIVIEDDKGMESNVCAHFAQCSHFLLVDIATDGQTIAGSEMVPNPVAHGGGGCPAVDEILKHKITHVIAGGMGMGAQNKFGSFGVKIFGYQGKAKDGLVALLKNSLTGIEPCKGHEEHGHSCHH